MHIYTSQIRGEQIKIYNVNSPLKKPTQQSCPNYPQNKPYKDEVKLYRLGLRLGTCVWPKIYMKGFTTMIGISSKPSKWDQHVPQGRQFGCVA